MKTLRLVLILAGLFGATHGYGFSRQGHESIALLAGNSPELSPTAKAAIKKILGKETMDFAAEWPDAIKPFSGALANTPEAVKFNRDHPQNRHWHFVNFPIGSTAYLASSPYAQPTDISHAIKGCIAVLEGTGSFDHLTKKQALRYLLHLVGDVHQPLHTTFEIWDVSNPAHPKMLPPAPKAPAGALFDGGANDLYYKDNEELHAEWDDDLVEAIVPSRRTDKLVAQLAKEVSATEDKATTNYHDWVDVWLGESMKLVPSVYAGLQYNDYFEVKNAQGKVSKKGIRVTLPANYAATHVKDAHTQIVRGASHLLQLLNAIQWTKVKG